MSFLVPPCFRYFWSNLTNLYLLSSTSKTICLEFSDELRHFRNLLTCSSQCCFCMSASVLHLPRDLLGRRPSPSSSLFLFTPTPLVVSRTKLTVCHCFVGVRFFSRREKLTRPTYSFFRFISVGVRIRSHSEFFRRSPPATPPACSSSSDHPVARPAATISALSAASFSCCKAVSSFEAKNASPRRHWPFALALFSGHSGCQPLVLSMGSEGEDSSLHHHLPPLCDHLLQGSIGQLLLELHFIYIRLQEAILLFHLQPGDGVVGPLGPEVGRRRPLIFVGGRRGLRQRLFPGRHNLCPLCSKLPHWARRVIPRGMGRRRLLHKLFIHEDRGRARGSFIINRALGREEGSEGIVGKFGGGVRTGFLLGILGGRGGGRIRHIAFNGG